MTSAPITIAFAWWWTGWHVFPIKSLIQYIDQHQDLYSKTKEIIWFWWVWTLEQSQAMILRNDLVNCSLNFAKISSGKLRREKSIFSLRKNFVDICFRVPWWILKSLMVLKSSKVDVVFCKWWYVAIPVIIAAKFLWIEIFMHESDTKLGITNKIAASYASKKFAGFDGVIKWAVTVGQILSNDLYFDWNTEKLFNQTKKGDRFQDTIKQIKTAKSHFKTIVLVTGGAQWARNLYWWLIDAIKWNNVLQTNFIFIMLLGTLNQQNFSEWNLPSNIITLDFASQKQMWALMYFSDLALLRWWTTTLAECKLYDLPLIIVPLPITHDQAQNAAYYHKHYKDIVLDQNKSSFVQDISLSLEKYSGFTKIHKNQNIVEQIESAKKVITNAIFKL